MAKWKCEICGNEFENFHAQGFDNKIYCPLCYFKKENQKLKKQLEKCYCNRTDCSGRIKDSKVYDSLVQKVETQQKEFIKYLEDMLDDENDMFSVVRVKDVLQKYIEIVNGSKQN